MLCSTAALCEDGGMVDYINKIMQSLSKCEAILQHSVLVYHNVIVVCNKFLRKVLGYGNEKRV
jgi:hypothetical protein